MLKLLICIASIGIILSRQRTTKAPIRLRESITGVLEIERPQSSHIFDDGLGLSQNYDKTLLSNIFIKQRMIDFDFILSELNRQ